MTFMDILVNGGLCDTCCAGRCGNNWDEIRCVIGCTETGCQGSMTTTCCNDPSKWGIDWTLDTCV